MLVSLKSSETELSFSRMVGVTAMALLLSVSLSACSTSTDEMLDAANPVNWFEDDETVPGSDEEYPNLGEVPARPVEPAVKREYEELQSGLVADVAEAKYSDEQLRSQTVPDSNLTLVQAQQLPDPAEPVAPPVATVVAPVVAAPAAVETTTASVTPSTAPAAEPLTPTVEQLASQQATTPPASAAGIAASPNVMPSQNTAADPATSLTPAALTPKLIATIYFPDGSASLTNVDKNVVAQVVEIYKQGGKAVFITGHSSSSANASDQVQAGMINFKMSLNRAKAVADAFRAHGIPKSRISVEARGSNSPRYIESNEAGVAGNRRAEIYIGY